LLFLFELFVALRLERFGDARGPDPACAEAAHILFALFYCAFVVGEGGKQGGGGGAGMVVLVWVAVVRDWTALGWVWG
jgi:hypothetical protein